MAWYKTGTVSVTNGSATVTGSGTAWVANARVGQAFALEGSGVQYEIAAVVSDTELTISPAYLGATQSGQSYALLPVVGFYREAYDALAAAVSQWSSYVATALSGLFGDGSAAAPGIGFEDETNTGLFRKAAGQLGLATAGVQRALLSSTAFQIDVPVSGTAVTQSSADTTAGRLVKVGDFGIGLDAGPVVTSLDDFYTWGSYFAYGGAHASAPTGTNPFPSLSGAFSLQVRNATLGASDEYIVQRATQFAAGAVSTKERVRSTSGGGWGAWREVFNASNILGTVSESSGTPTGAIIEQGSNANGQYVRFADGTQICDARLTSSSSAQVTWTFPAAFTATPQVIATANSDSGRMPATTAGGATNVNFSVWNTIQVRVDAISTSLIAIGRWF